jgi:Protein of unknown function (DUF3999)
MTRNDEAFPLRTHRVCVLAILFIVATIVTGAPSLADSDIPDAWRAWRYSRAIEVTTPPTNPSSPARIDIPFDLYGHSEHELSDVRVIDDTGAETPFLFYGPQFQPPVENRTATLGERSFLPNQYTQLVIDLGPGTAFHNGVEIRTSQTNFINWVEIAVSDDAKTWRIVKDRAPISSFQAENITGSRLVRYPDTNARYIRERIFEPAHQFPVSSVAVSFTREPKATPQETLPIALDIDPKAPKGSTRWTVDLGQSKIPVDGVRFATSQPQFFRVVRLQSSEDNENWVDYCAGEIYRYKQGDKQAESLQVTTPFVYWKPRYWRIEILNANDAPLAGVTATLLATPRALLFFPQPGHTYRILYGNDTAKQPTYDLARTFDAHTWPEAGPATLANEVATANFLDTRPFTERHPYVLWIAFLFGVAALGYAALRALKSTGAQNT